MEKPPTFVAAVRKTASRHRMDLSRPLVLVSGGPDSTALLRAILDLGGEPAVLHVHHGLRGGEADADEAFVRSLCEQLGLRFEARRLSLSEESNLQARAREERYRVAEKLAGEIGASAIATGHTADDVAETVLMNLARGAGLRGLSGIPPRRGRVVRPLIEVSREQVVGYLESLGQSYRTDSTNLAPKYARNRLRLEVLPLLEAMYPGASRNISRAAGLLREDLEALEALAAAAVEERGEEVAVVREKLAHPALLPHALRLAFEKAAPEVPPLDADLVRAVEGLLEKGEGTRALDLPAGVVAAARFGKEVAFYEPGGVEAGEKELAPGETSFAGWDISVREGVAFHAEDAARGEVAYLDGGKGPYRVRLAREGDTIRPLGLGGTKKVFRAMMDRKVPKDLRRQSPVVVGGGGEVAWVFEGEVDERFAVGEKTEKTLRLEVRRR